MTRFRSGLTFANVVSVLALFVALGGSATAAVLITGKQVKNGSLTGVDVKNSSLTGGDLKNNSVGNLDIKDGDLLAKDFKPGQLPAGPPGPQGQQGEPGIKGDTGTARAYALVNSDGTLVAAKTKNVVQVTRPFEGSYCVVLPAGVDATKVEGTVSPNYVSAPFLPIAQINTDRSHCGAANAIKVQTSRVAQDTGTKAIHEDPENSSFFIIVP